MEVLIGYDGTVLLDREVVPGAFAARERHVKHQELYYVRNRDGVSFQIARIGRNVTEVWAVNGQAIGPYGEYILRFEGTVDEDGLESCALAEAVNFCIWADSYP